MNKNKFQSDSGGTKTKTASEDERFLTVMNQVLDRHYTIATKNNESQHLQNALKTL